MYAKVVYLAAQNAMMKLLVLHALLDIIWMRANAYNASQIAIIAQITPNVLDVQRDIS